MNRTTFLVDGFNLYHSIRDLYNYQYIRVKWLDIPSLCNSLLSWVGNKATFQDVYYFSAYAFHLNDPEVIARHKLYVRCLAAKGVHPVMGRFKPKRVSCPKYNCTVASCPDCSGVIVKNEEKETDVAIATKLMELFSKDNRDSIACETIVLISGDTDLAPTIRTAIKLFPDKSIKIAFPFRRKNAELAQLVPSVNLKPQRYLDYQFPQSVPIPDDNLSLIRPPTW